ncbi:hypothetical protein ALC53_04813 [Atta colombica]|uniref:Uncharacterized protein n=1 Tax=Atta colombica TaxID=520822 RepID=A0A195BK83_9HYME|nr:hypothetical protein ALC53_04813 [Atta colombica]
MRTRTSECPVVRFTPERISKRGRVEGGGSRDGGDGGGGPGGSWSSVARSSPALREEEEEKVKLAAPSLINNPKTMDTVQNTADLTPLTWVPSLNPCPRFSHQPPCCGPLSSGLSPPPLSSDDSATLAVDATNEFSPP